jgi:drug/metabolite transporter (DMT)-like permease
MRASGNLRGSVLVVASIALSSVMMVATRLIGERLPITETLFVRHVVTTVLIIPLLAPGFGRALRSRRPGLQILQGLFTLGSQLGYFVALLHLPFAELTALGFSQVIFMTVAAALLLREQVGIRRWAATLVGFAGVLIVLKPTGAAFNSYAIIATASAVLVCGSTVAIRLLSASETAATIMIWQSLVLCAAYALPAALAWEWPTGREWWLLLVIGVFGAASQYLFTLAFRLGEAAALAPLEYTRLMAAAAIGYLVFAEIPDLATVIGSLMIVGATADTVRRNMADGAPRDGVR